MIAWVVLVLVVLAAVTAATVVVGSIIEALFGEFLEPYSTPRKEDLRHADQDS